MTRSVVLFLGVAVVGGVIALVLGAQKERASEPVRVVSTSSVGSTEHTSSCLAHTNACAVSQRMPLKKWPDVSGVVIDGKLDTSTPNLEAVVRCLKEQQEAAKAGDMTRYHERERQGMTNLLNIVASSRPIPHAAVSLFSHKSAPHRGGPWSVTADAEGKFEFFDVPRGLYRVVATDTRNGTNNGLSAEMMVEHYRTREQVRIVIHPETVTVKGRVTDSSGQPVTNVTVLARRGHERYVPTEGDFTRAYHETTALTDSEGRYALRGLIPAGLWEAGGLESGGYGGADAWYTVRVAAPGYAAAKAHVPIVSEEMRQTARTFSGLLKGLASAHAKAGRRKADPVSQPACHGHTLTGVDFALYKPVCVEGSFVNKGGLPQQGYTIVLSLTNRADACSYQAFTENSYRTQCDAKGRFHFDGLAPGVYQVQAYEDNRLVSSKPLLVVNVREGEPISDLCLVNDALPYGKIVGVVSDAVSGTPIKGVTSYSVHKQTGATDCPRWFCLCGKRGYHTAECKRWMARVSQTNDMRISTFVVEKAMPGQTEIVLKAPDYAEERVVIDVAPEGLAKLDIKLWRAGTALIRPVIKSGTCVDYYASVSGHPPIVHYVAIPERSGSRVCGGGSSKQLAGCDELTGLKPGRYHLRCDILYLRGSVARYETVPLEIVSGQSSEVELDFRGTCEIKLKVDFDPGSAVTVLLEKDETPVGVTLENNLGLRASAYLREPGSIVIPDLKPGAYRLSLFRRNVPEKKGVAKKMEPDEVKTLTLDEGNALQTFSFRF